MPDPNCVVCTTDDSVTIVGPFDTYAQATAYGEKWQEDNGDDPRWQTVYLANPSKVVHIGPRAEKQHTGLPVHGYVSQSADRVALVNVNKQLEETILQRIDYMAAQDGSDPNSGHDRRWLAIARTDIEKGFMALNRAVFRPERVKLDGDK